MLKKQPAVHNCVPNLQVGHALENDLAALRVLHSRCIDTAALFPHPKALILILSATVVAMVYMTVDRGQFAPAARAKPHDFLHC